MSQFEVSEKFDIAAMDQFMRTPSVYWSAVDALAPQPEEMTFVEHLLHQDVLTYACLFQDVIVGYVQFIKRTSIGGEIHVGFHEKFRGKIAKSFIEYAIALCFRAKHLVKLWAMIPSDNVAAVRLARQIGFEHEGRIKEAVVRSAEINAPPKARRKRPDSDVPIRDLVILGLKRN